MSAPSPCSVLLAQAIVPQTLQHIVLYSCSRPTACLAKRCLTLNNLALDEGRVSCCCLQFYTSAKSKGVLIRQQLISAQAIQKNATQKAALFSPAAKKARRQHDMLTRLPDILEQLISIFRKGNPRVQMRSEVRSFSEAPRVGAIP